MTRPPPTLKLSNYEDCPSRHKRLQKAVHFMEARGGISPLVMRLHDHKGILFVCWLRKPDNLDSIRLIYAAWEDQAEYTVCHVIGDDPYATPWLEDSGGPPGQNFARIEYTFVKSSP